MKTWNPEELQTLAELYPSTSNADLAKHFNCTKGSVQVKAYRLGLHKDEAHQVHLGAVVSNPCKYGDRFCPCPDGDPCHYEGKNPWPAPPAPPSDSGAP